MSKRSKDPVADILEIIFKGIWSLVKVTARLISKPFRKNQVNEKMNKVFSNKFLEVGMKDKSGATPKCVYYKYDKEKRQFIYVFESMIPFDTWKANINYLKVVLDKKIYQLSPYKKQTQVLVVATDNENKLPEKIDWRWSMLDPSPTKFKLGVDIMGNVITFDLNDTPHLLIAGTTGNGKSVAMQLIVGQALMHGWKCDFIDFKNLEFGSKFKVFGDVGTTLTEARDIIKKAIDENKARSELFERVDVKKIAEYNKKFPQDKLCYSLIFIDELAEVLDPTSISKKDKETFEELKGYLFSLARLGRSQGIFIAGAIQRPEARVLSGQIRDQMNVRVCGYFPNKEAYEMVLGSMSSHLDKNQFIREVDFNIQDKNSTIKTDELPLYKGRFAFMDNSIPRMIQAYYYETSMLDPSKIMIAGRHLTSKKKGIQNPVKESTEKVTVDIPKPKIQKKEVIEFDYD